MTHGLSPWRTAYEAEMRLRELAVTRPRPVKEEPLSVELGQEARTGKWYCKSLALTQRENEGELDFLDRLDLVKARLLAVLGEAPVEEEVPIA